MTLWDGGIDYSPYAGGAPAPQAGTYINNTSKNIYTWYIKTWATFASSITNLTTGNGTETARYYSIGGRVHFLWSFTLGSTSALTATPVTVDYSTLTMQALYLSGTAAAYDSSAALWYPIASHGESGGEITLRATSTFPFTWATGDVLSCSWTFIKTPEAFSVGL